MFHSTQIWIELLLFGQSWFSQLEFTQISPIYGNIFEKPKKPIFEQDCLKLPTIEWNCCKLATFYLTDWLHLSVSN